MRRLAGLSGTTLIHHSLTDCIPLKAQHANTISSTAGHLTSTSLTQLHANSIRANAAPLTNTSVTGLEILWLRRYWWKPSHLAQRNHVLYFAAVTFVAPLLMPSFVSEVAAPKDSCSDSVWFCPPQIWLKSHASVRGAIPIRLWFHISHRQCTTRMIFN